MKTCILLLLASMLGAAAQAPSPAASPTPAAPTAGKPAPDQLGEMRRALRQAMTNAATAAVAGATNASSPSAPGTAGTPAPVAATAGTATAAPAATAPSPAAGSAAAAPANPNLRPVPTRSSGAAATPAAPGGATRPAAAPAPVTRPAPAPGGARPVTVAPVPALPGATSPAVAAGAAAPTAGPAVPPPVVETTDDGQPDPDQIIPAGTLQVQNMPLDQFFELYSLISGRTVLRPNALAVGQGAAITLKAQTDWTRKEAVFAMDAALALNGVAILPIDEKFVKAVAKQDAPTEGAQLSKVRAGNYSESDEFVTQVVELKVLKPSEVVQLIQSFSKVPNGITPFDNNNTIVIRDHAMNVKRMLEVIEKVDVAKETDYKLEIIPIRYGRVEDFFNTMSSLVSGSGGAAAGGANLGAPAAGTTGTSVGMQQQGRGRGGSARMGRTQGGGYGSGMYGGGMYGGGMYGGGRYYPQQATVPQQTSVGGAQSTFQQRLQQIVNRASRPGEEEVQILENAKLVPDPKSNTLLIYAHKKDLEMITNIVAKLDVLQAQVLIEAVIFEVTLGDNLNFGVSMAQSPKRFGEDFAGAGAINNGQGYLANAITNFPGALPGGLTYFSKIGSDLDVTIKAIADNSDINVLSRPRIQTSHAIPGAFFVGEQIPYASGAYDYGFGTTGSGITRSIVNYLDVGFDLSVTPYITPEGYVVMEIYQEFKNRTRDVIIDGNPIPSVNQRSAEASVIVRDGQTIMLGGFIGERKSHSKSGVPFLKDIPGLGFLFRSSNDSSERIELVVLMRAKVLQTPEDAFHVAEQETSILPGVQNAQQAFKKTDEKRRKQLEKRKK